MDRPPGCGYSWIAPENGGYSWTTPAGLGGLFMNRFRKTVAVHGSPSENVGDSWIAPKKTVAVHRSPSGLVAIHGPPPKLCGGS